MKKGEEGANGSFPDWITKILIPIGSILIAVLVFIQNSPAQLWATTIISVYLFIVTCAVLYRPFIGIFSFFRGRIRRRSLAKKYFPNLDKYADRLELLIDQHKSSNLIGLMQEIVGWNDESRAFFLDSELLFGNKDWLSSVQNRLKNNRGSVEKFDTCASDLSRVIYCYHTLCTAKLRLLETLLKAGRIPQERLPYLKQEWNLRRESHMLFIREWESLSKEINQKAGRQICLEWYGPLRTID